MFLISETSDVHQTTNLSKQYPCDTFKTSHDQRHIVLNIFMSFSQIVSIFQIIEFSRFKILLNSLNLINLSVTCVGKNEV